MPIQEDLQAFLAEWHDPSPFLEVQTSGSTGTPKRMRVRKDRMLNSARLTCDYLGLKKGDKALLCMPLRYIAGKMMVVRSLTPDWIWRCVNPPDTRWRIGGIRPCALPP